MVVQQVRCPGLLLQLDVHFFLLALKLLVVFLYGVKLADYGFEFAVEYFHVLHLLLLLQLKMHHLLLDLLQNAGLADKLAIKVALLRQGVPVLIKRLHLILKHKLAPSRVQASIGGKVCPKYTIILLVRSQIRALGHRAHFESADGPLHAVMAHRASLHLLVFVYL